MTLSRPGIDATIIFDGQRYPAGMARVLCVEQSFSPAGRNIATIEVTLGQLPQVLDEMKHLVNFQGWGKLYHREVEIVYTAGGVERVIHWGRIESALFGIGKRADTLTLTSYLQPCHFTAPVQGIVVNTRHATGSDVLGYIDSPIVFNGYAAVGETHHGNRSHKRSTLGCYTFQPLEGAETLSAMNWHRAGSETSGLRGDFWEWTLRDAVEYLCTTTLAETNIAGRVPSQGKIYIEPPTAEELRTIPHIVLPRKALATGKHLSELLDLLLAEYGVRWYVKHTEPGRRRIAFAVRGKGKPIDVKLQPPGSTLDLDQTNTEETRLKFSTTPTVNAIHVKGGKVQVEGTWELTPAWDDEHDNLLPGVLSKDSDSYKDNPDFRDVFRKWTLNESGDYIDMRSGLEGPFDFREQFNADVVGKDNVDRIMVRRRRFLPCLARRANDSQPIGPVVEWYDYDRWRPIQEGTDDASQRPKILADECGIRFDMVKVPYKLYTKFKSNDGLRLRVTATIEGDWRVQRFVEPKMPSLKIDRSVFTWEASSKYQLRRILTEGGSKSIHAADVEAGTLDSNQTDDVETVLDRMEKDARKHLDAWDQAQVAGRVTLFGLDHDVELGNVVQKINGRELSLRTTHSSAPAKYPEVTGISYDFGAQSIGLSLQRNPRREKPIK